MLHTAIVISRRTRFKNSSSKQAIVTAIVSNLLESAYVSKRKVDRIIHQLCSNTSSSGTFSPNGDLLGVATECSNVLLDPA